MKVSIKQINAKEFGNHKEQWNALLAETQVDHFFLSWEWQHTWWQTWGEMLNAQLLILLAYSDTGELIGIAPCYASAHKIKKLISVTRVQFIGNIWRGEGTVRTEYLDFIVKPCWHTEVVRAFIEYVDEQIEHSEFVICDLNKASDTYALLTGAEPLGNYKVRIPETDLSSQIILQGSFEDYLAGLGKHTRSRLYNRRSLLAKKGDIEISYASVDTLSEYFATMNELHSARWGKNLFNQSSYHFHDTLCKQLNQRGNLRFSMLCVSGQPLSALYNIRLNGHEYYIQSGFNQNYDKKLSLGFLHLGYAIESAFKDGVKVFDLLIGKGKQTYYKTHIAKHETCVCTLQLVRNSKIAFLYKAYDALAFLWQRYCRKC